MRRISAYVILSLITLISTFMLWMPFLTGSTEWFGLRFEPDGFERVYKHYDGPWYVVVAKTFYDPKAISGLKLETSLPDKYFSAHLPLYPVLIRIFSALPIPGDLPYMKAMLAVNVLSSVALGLFFYWMVGRLNLSKNPLALAAVFLMLPRFLVLRSVGAPESLFVLLILASLYSFERKRYLASGILGGLATMTKTPGILLFGAYGLVFAERFISERKIDWKWSGILLIPLSLVAVFMLYGARYGDFLAYFNSGDNIHLVSPFSVFNSSKAWIGTAWLEDSLFYFIAYGLAVAYLWNNRYRSLFFFSAVFLAASLFIQHRDIGRYSLPLWPMAAIAFERLLTSRKFLAVGLVMLPGILFYAWNFLGYNVMPIADWTPFL